MEWSDEMKSAAMKDAQRVCETVEALRTIRTYITPAISGEKHRPGLSRNVAMAIAAICDRGLKDC